MGGRSAREGGRGRSSGREKRGGGGNVHWESKGADEAITARTRWIEDGKEAVMGVGGVIMVGEGGSESGQERGSGCVGSVG